MSNAEPKRPSRSLPPHLFEPWNSEVYTVFRYVPQPGWWERVCDRTTSEDAHYEADKQADSGFDVLVTHQRVTHWQRTLVSRQTPAGSGPSQEQP